MTRLKYLNFVSAILWVLLGLSFCSKSGAGGGKVRPGPEPTCGTPSTGPCPDPEACTSDADCNEELPACDLEISRCVQCNDDSHCLAELPACKISEHQCVRCLRTSHCSSDGTLVCNQEEQSCDFFPREWELHKVLGTRQKRAKEFSLFHPQSIAIDESGSLFLMDINNAIFRIDSDGGVIRVGGIEDLLSERFALNGDGHLAVETVFKSRGFSIALGPYGNLFVADSQSRTIRKIAFSPNQGITAPGTVEEFGRVYTVAGNGEEEDNAEQGPAIEASFIEPRRVVFDAFGNLFVVDAGNKVFKIVYRANTGFVLNPSLENSGHVYHVAGMREQGEFEEGAYATRAKFNDDMGRISYSGISDIAFDSFFNMYLAHRNAHRVTKIPQVPNQGIRSEQVNEQRHHAYTVVGTGDIGQPIERAQAAETNLSYPNSVAVDKWNNLFVSLEGVSQIIKVVHTPNTGIQGAFENERIGEVLGIAGTQAEGDWGDGAPALQSQLDGPVGLSFDTHGNLYFGEFENNRISKIVFEPGTGVLSDLNEQRGFLYVLGGDGRSIRAGMGERALSSEAGSNAMAFDSSDNLYLWGSGLEQISKVVNQPATGLIVQGVTEQIGRTYRVAGKNQFDLFRDEDPLQGDNGPAKDALLMSIRDLQFDRFDNLYLADGYNHRLRKIVNQQRTGIFFNEFEQRGNIYTVAGTNLPPIEGQEQVHALQKQLERVQALTQDEWGNLYVSKERGRTNVILKLIEQPNTGIRSPHVPIEEKGNIIRIAGLEQRGFEGDFGPAIEAELNFPGDLAVDSHGNLYVADIRNHRIRKIVREAGGPGSHLREEEPGHIYSVIGNGMDRNNQLGVPINEDGPALEQAISSARNLVFDEHDNLYFLESIRNEDGQISRVRKYITEPNAGMTISGVEENEGELITLFSGSFLTEEEGDGGPIQDATLGEFFSFAFDQGGNVYLGEQRRVRKIVNHPNQGPKVPYVREREGFVYSVLGAEEPRGFDEWNFSRLPTPASFVPFTLANQKGFMVTSWMAGRALFVNVDARHTEVIGGYHDGYLEGQYSRRLLHPFAGVDSVPFRFARLLKGAQDIVWDEISRSFYVAEQSGPQITQIKVHNRDDVGSWTMNRFAGLNGNAGNEDGVGSLARFEQPFSLALDEVNGYLYLSDQGENRIRRITLRTAEVTTLSLINHQEESIDVSRVGRIALDTSGKLWLIDKGEDVLMQVDTDSGLTELFFEGRNFFEEHIPGTTFEDTLISNFDNMLFAENGDLFLASNTQVLWVHALDGVIDMHDPTELIVDLSQDEVSSDNRFIRQIRDLYLDEDGREKKLYILEAGEGAIFRLNL